MTSDATFDIAYRQFSDIEKNLSTLHTQCVNLVNNVDTWCNTNRKLADELKRFTNTAPVSSDEMQSYLETVNHLHEALQREYDQTRRAIITILRVRVVSRIDHLLKDDFSQIQKIMKNRKNIITDYDSHRQKCSTSSARATSTRRIVSAARLNTTSTCWTSTLPTWRRASKS